jgi:pyruvate ferredoxin oxidoreductase delta subunit
LYIYHSYRAYIEGKIMAQQYKSWKDLPIGAVVPGGTCYVNKTGTWRVSKPVLDRSKCTKCLLCWIYCPDVAIALDEENISIEYDYCKGCGICANECPVGAIKMVEEAESQ